MSFSAVGLALVLGASFSWSGYDLLRKILVDRVAGLPLLFALTLAQAPFFMAWLAMEGAPEVSPAYLLPGSISVILNVGANVALIRALAISPLSLTIPLLSLTPAFTALMGIPLLGELPSAVQAFGILLVVIGAFSLNLQSGEGVSATAVWLAFRREKGSALVILVALLWSLTGPLDKLAIRASSVPFHAVVLSLGVALGVLALFAPKRGLKDLGALRGLSGTFTLAVVVSVFALGLQLLAYKFVWVSLVETLKRGIGNVTAVVFGRLFFSETITARKVAAVLLMAAGVGLILS